MPFVSASAIYCLYFEDDPNARCINFGAFIYPSVPKSSLVFMLYAADLLHEAGEIAEL